MIVLIPSKSHKILQIFKNPQIRQRKAVAVSTTADRIGFGEFPCVYLYGVQMAGT